MAPLLFLLIAFSKVFCLKGDALRTDDFKNALGFINELRHCCIQSEFRWFKLPELTRFAKTLNSVVNSTLEEEYIRFWQAVRKIDYEQDMQRLAEHSKGAALSLHLSPDANSDLISYSGSDEAALLRPVFKNDMRLYSSGIKLKGQNVLDRFARLVRDNAPGYDRLKKEMILGAIHFLDVALLVRTRGWYANSAHVLESLRTGDRALRYIRDWNFHNTMPRMLYLTFILHARRIILYLSEQGLDCDDESRKVTTLQNDFERLIITEFPSQMAKEVWRSTNVDYQINVLKDQFRSRHVVRAVYLWSVGKVGRSSNVMANVYLDGSTLYITADESVEETHVGGWSGLYGELIIRITHSSFIMSRNPNIVYRTI